MTGESVVVIVLSIMIVLFMIVINREILVGVL